MSNKKGNGDIGYISTKKAFKTAKYACEISCKWYGSPQFTPEVEKIIIETVKDKI